MSYVDAIKTRLAFDPVLIARLARWEFVTGTKAPAIFCIAPAPPACEQPLITITDEPASMAPLRGRADSLLSFVVTTWGNKGESDRELRELAHRAFRLLMGQTLTTVDGDKLYILGVAAPQRITDTDGFPGFVVIVNARISEELIS